MTNIINTFSEIRNMKHRIAVYSNGFNGSITLKAIEGIKKYAKLKDIDAHFYIGFASGNRKDTINIGQFNIYKLADLNEYDGLIIFSGLLNDPSFAKEIIKNASQTGIPIVSVGVDLNGATYVGINNRDGMRELVEHLITEHKVKKIAYIGGTKDHYDTVERLEVVKEVMKKHGLKLPKKNIFYGDWGNEKSIEAADKLAEDRDKMPDAIICANDIMALSVETELRDLGFDLPKDVIVTGFDNIGNGGISYPALTTVEQDYVTVGFNSCKIIYDMVEDKKKTKYSMVSSKLITGESCGCNQGKNNPYDMIRRDYCSRVHARSKMADFFNRSMREERRIILKSSDYEDMKRNLRALYERSHEFVGGNFFVMLNRDFFEDFSIEEDELLDSGYNAVFDTTVSLIDGRISDMGEKLPGFDRIPGEQHVYFFYPLHDEQYNYGYVVFRDGTYIINEDFRIYEYLEKMQQSFMEFRIKMHLDTVNRELRNLYDKDPMTGLYNRFCFVSHAIPIVEESSAHDSQALIMFVDINNMKKINDRYGHVYGDRAIDTVSDAIKDGIGDDNAIGIRYGGDEFLVIAADADIKYAEKIKRRMNSYIDKENKRGTNPFKFSVSIGYVLTDPKSKRTVNDYVDEADRLMYGIKNEYHKKHPND